MSTSRGGGGKRGVGDSQRSSGSVRGGAGGGRGDSRHTRGGSDRGGGGGGRGGGSGGGSGGHRGDGDHHRGGSGGGYGRGGGRAVEPVTRNVRESGMFDVPQVKHKIMEKFKKSYGRDGRKIKLISNYFALTVGDKTVYHYDIEIRLAKARDVGREAGGGDTAQATTSTVQMPASSLAKKMRRLALKENIEIIRKLSTEWDAFNGVSYVYDGLKNLYALKNLRFLGASNKQYSREVSIKFDGFQEQLYEVLVQKAIKKGSVDCQEAINLSTITHFYDTTVNEIPEAAHQMLEILLKYMPIQELVPIGRSLYPQLTAQEIRDNDMGESAVMSYGHYQSVRLTEVGAAVLIDRKATVLHYSGSLIDFIINLVPRVHNREQLKRFSFTGDAALITDLNKHLSGLKIITTHIRNERRKCTIDKLTARRPNEIEFPWTKIDQITGSSQTVTTNIVNYYQKHYDKTLEFLNIPCILAKGGRVQRFFPVEICEVCPNQPLQRKLISKDITAQMVRKSGQQLPINRFSKITESAEMIADCSRELLDAFGVEMSTIPMQVPARVLTEPNCEGNDRRVKDGKQLNKWIFVNLSQKVEANITKAREFVENLITVARGMGIAISQLNPAVGLLRGVYRNGETIRNAFNEAKKRYPDVQMIIFCIPLSNEIYHYIKYYGDVVFGIITQCIKDDNLLDTPRGYETNILLKINGKLDGKNSIIPKPQKPRILTDKPTIVIGCDVSHPAPADRMLQSVAACIGSYDPDFSKYSASITVQPRSRDEIINHFGRMIKELLEQFKAKNNNKVLPQTIIIFRDGVSESQFDIVIDREYDLLKQTCREMGIDQPKITFVIVQKRHHTRFLPFDPNDGKGKAGNIPPGTVVDSIITNPVLFEYYLCSHFGLQGTSRPTKYVVLRDDNKLSADEMQKLSYYLCFTYARCNKSISIPTPVMYAHLAAYRAKLHIVAQTVDNEDQNNEQRAEREQISADELNERVKVNEALRARLYYC